MEVSLPPAEDVVHPITFPDGLLQCVGDSRLRDEVRKWKVRGNDHLLILLELVLG